MKTFASDFASLADLRKFQEAKARGLTDRQAFKFGDNGLGCWGSVTAQDHTPMCALPPEDMIAEFGSQKKAKFALVNVTVHDRTITCVLADVMPRKQNITNGCGIDLNPAALKALGLTSPIKVACEWQWAD